MSQQLVKKGANGGMVNVNPKSWIEAIKDKNTGQTLVEILQGFNMYFLPYSGNTSSTRCLVPIMLRKKGLWITYVKYDGNVYTEWYAADEIDDKSWGDSSNWRIGNNTLVGDITISANGNWVINGVETEFKAVGEKGNTPLIRVANNRLQVSYDLGDTYIDVTNNPVYTKFRWLATTGDTQANNVGRIQASTDEGKTWTNMSNDFTNNLHIKKYIGVNESLPTNGIAEGTIYAKGPYYAEDDALNDNPIYRLWVYAWKGNTLAWQDNGEFTSISAGVVQETGDSETEVMSQKATTDNININSVRGFSILYNQVIDVESHNLVKTYNFDSIVVKINDSTRRIKVEGVNTTYYNVFSKYKFTSDNFLKAYSGTGNINAEGGKYVVISIPKETNPDADYTNVKVSIIDDGTPNLGDRGCSILYNKQLSVSSSSTGNVFSLLYDKDSDVLVIPIHDSNIKEVEVLNIEVGGFFYFSSLIPSEESYISYGKLTSDAQCLACNIKKKETDNYSNIGIRYKLNYTDNNRFESLFNPYLKIIPTSKNYINKDDLLVGYTISSGNLIPSPTGALTNKIYLEHGKTYTMQGIYFYGASNRIFIGYFNANGEYIGRGYLDAIYEEGSRYGKATFTFNDQNGLIKFIRIVVAGAGYPFNPDIAQLEEGTEATEIVPFTGKEVLNIGNINNESEDSPTEEVLKESKHIKLLCIGNSYSQDALAYVPYIMKSLAPDVNVTIGILYLSGARLNQHYDNYINDNDSYIFYKYVAGNLGWSNISSSYTIKQGINNDKWDMILLHQGSMASFDWDTYQPYLNKLIDLIYNDTKSAIKFGWMLTQSRPKSGDTVFSDKQILENYNNIAANSKRVMEETLCEFIIPVGTAVQNARNTSLNNIGDYGKLCSSDGGHLQEGLPSQLAAYVCVLKLLELIGESYKSIYGDTNRITSDWVMDKNIPGANGSPIGSDDYNCSIAQKCAIMAVKNPYQITNMIELGIVDE